MVELPEEVQSAYERWCGAQPWETTFVERLPGGRSGAKLVVVQQFQMNEINRQVILKFLPGELERELDRISQALRESPTDFRNNHLMRVIGGPVVLGSWQMITLSVAGGDLSSIRPLADLAHDSRLSAACAVVTKQVLSAWNPTSEHRPEAMTAAEYVGMLLADRPDRLERVREWAPTGKDIPDGPFATLPNPLAFLEGHFSGSKRIPIQRGRAHGDLNVRNILLSPDTPEWFWLIDFGDYAPDAPLARDPAHLLLSMAVEWLRDTTENSSQRDALMTAILTPAKATAGPHTEVSVVLRGAGQAHAKENGFGREWEQQSLLSIVGCALMFAGRKLPHDLRRWFFDLAARGVKGYIEVSGDSEDPDAPAGGSMWKVSRRRADIAMLALGQLTSAQQRMGNHERLVSVVLKLLDEDEQFVRLAPCRVRREAYGSAVLVVSNSRIHAAELDDSFQPSDVWAVTHDEIEDVRLRPGIRADVVIVTRSAELVAGGLFQEQAEQMVEEIRRLIGKRSPSEGWCDLVRELRTATFNSTTAAHLAAETESLRMALDRERQPYPDDPMDVDLLIQQLCFTLDEGTRVSTSNSHVYAARAAADLIRGRLLDKLT
ncbi:hypothetical protein [Streptosporangium amethystogenes]|uniref:hypothetical protein n=1 Tax=Streptosporangium amethystogenes TaxID=2002 RepID=UPI0004CBCD85|nr:hypothetical protein [Streptosporangium amethystogenes]